MRLGLLFVLILALLGLPARSASAAAGQDAWVVVEARVTSAAGGSVYIDLGREAGLEIGDDVRLFSLTGPPVVGRIRSVSRTNARIELTSPVGPIGGVELGTRVEIRVPRTRFATEAPPEKLEGSGELRGVPEAPSQESPAEQTAVESEDPAAAIPVPEHPPWTAEEVEWEDDRPLLAPALGVEPEDRPSRFSGRFFTDVTVTNDREANNDYGLGRSGAALSMDNPFGQGGGMEFVGDVYWKHTDADNQDTDDEVELRLDRFSYWWGGQRGKPRRFEFGRFLQREFPEFGILDGAEFSQRTEGGSRFGASVGYMPEPTDKMKTGKDLQVAAFYRWASDENETYTLGGGYQKTWHEGEPDRDLAVFTTRLRPTQRTAIFGTAWVDFYGDDDSLKDDSVELTQAILNANYSWEGGHGLGVFYSHLRWPDIDRNEFATLTPELVSDNRLSRVGLNAWAQLSRKIRAMARVDAWDDQDDSGGSGELTLDLRDLLYKDGSVGLSVFDTGGAFSDGLGWRIRATKRLDAGLLGLSWDATNFEQDGFSGSQSELLQHTVRAAWDFTVGSDWNFSLFGEDRFGDQQDSITVGFFLQRSF